MRLKRNISEFNVLPAEDVDGGRQYCWRCKKCGIFTAVNVGPQNYYDVDRLIVGSKCRCTLKGDVTDLDWGEIVRRKSGNGPKLGKIVNIDRRNGLIQMGQVNLEARWQFPRYFPETWHAAENYELDW